jgi:signal transduction histidine kinase
MPDAIELHEALRIVMERCYRMNRFISNFADVVRIPEANVVMQDINPVIDDCLRFMETALQSRRITLSKTLSVEPLIVPIDAGLFEQALLNILKNAVEAIENEDGCICIITSDNPATLEIVNNGARIAPEVQARLFTPFFSTKPEGQGVGLLLIREVLLRHGFSFSLSTGADGLTRFRIVF